MSAMYEGYPVVRDLPADKLLAALKAQREYFRANGGHQSGEAYEIGIAEDIAWAEAQVAAGK